jgi:hypothetical protein
VVEVALAAPQTRTAVSGAVARAVVGAGVFWIAFDHGSYSVAQRTSLGVLAWWAVVLAAIAGVMSGLRFARAARASIVAFVALAVVDLLSLVWSHDATSAFAEFERVLVLVGVAVLTLVIAARFGSLAVADGVAFGIAAVAVLAIASRFFGGIGTDRMPPTFAALSSLRLSYPLDYWNGLAIFVALAAPLLLARASRPGPVAVRALAAAPLPLVVGVIYLASSRGGAAVLSTGAAVFLVATELRWRAAASLAVTAVPSAAGLLLLVHWPLLANGPLDTQAAHTQGHHAAFAFAVLCAAAAGGQALVAMLEPARPRSHRTLGLALAIAGGAVALGVAISVHPVTIARNFTRAPQVSSSHDFVRQHLLAANGSGRWQQWTAAVHEWEAHPVFGGGAGTYEHWWLTHESLTLQVRNAHSLFLETLAELGIVGAALLVVAFGSALAAGVARVVHAAPEERHFRAGLLGGFVAFLVASSIDWMWQLTAVAAVGMVLLALLADPAPERTSARRTTTVVLGATAAAALAALAIGLLSAVRLDDSHAAAARGDLSGALAAARDARRLEPWSSPPYLQIALVQEQMGRLRVAHRAIEQALDRSRNDWQLWLVDARLETKLGRLGEARNSLRRAVSLNPNSALFSSLQPSSK